MASDKQRLFKEFTAQEMLSKNLSRLASVTRYDTLSEKEAWNLTHDISDLEESFYELLDDLFPKLLESQISEEELFETLIDIGEEFRHILYHIGASNFFSYLRA